MSAVARRAALSAGTALVLVLVAGACGSGSGGVPSARPSPRATATATATPSPTPGIAGPGTTLTVIAPLGLNIRDQGSTSGAVLGSLGQGSVVTVVAHSGQNGGWYEVKGETVTGWITDNPAYTSPRHFELYQSDAHGFSALYLNTWVFAEGGPSMVSFHPQSGPYPQITVANGHDLAALGAPGSGGYATVEVDSAEVYGVTGALKLSARGASATAAPASPGQPPAPPLLAELRVTLDASRAMRLDFLYSSADDLRTFRDFYGSIIVPTPASPGAATSKPAA